MKNSLNSFSSLHPVVLMTYFMTVIIVSMFSTNPVILSLALIGGFSFSLMLSGLKNLLSDLGFYIPMFLLIVILNPLFSHNGVTPLFFMNGNPVTSEAVFYGVNIALMIVGVIYWCKCYSEIITTDKFLFLFGKAVPKLSLVLSMALRFIPLFKRKLKEIRGVQKSLGLYNKKGIVDNTSSELKVFSSLTTWSLENSVDTALSMKARGYGLKGRSHFSMFHFRKRDFIYLALILFVFSVTILSMATGSSDYSFYPEMSELKFSYGYISFGILSFMPFITELWEVIVWKCSVSKI